MTYTELKQWLPVTTPYGKGYACGLIDYGQEHHLLYNVILDESGVLVQVANPDVRVRPNPSMRAKRLGAIPDNLSRSGDPARKSE